MMAIRETYAKDVEAESHSSVPMLSYDRLSSLLGHCAALSPQQQRDSGCSACDKLFFSCISQELAAVSRHFDQRVQWLLQMHLPSGFKKSVLKIKHKQARNHVAIILEAQKLLNYASIMTLAAHTLLQDYDKVHASCEGWKFKAWLVGMHMEVLQSPWLVELLALYFNLKSGETRSLLPELCQGCNCDVRSGNKLTLSCMPHESIKVEIKLTCSICLETVFDPMALKCGHIFCFSCACAAASIPTYEGLKTAEKNAKCPLCRETLIFASATRLTELNLLIYRRCKDYWNARRQRERKDRMKQIKEHWSYRPEDVGTPTVFLL